MWVMVCSSGGYGELDPTSTLHLLLQVVDKLQIRGKEMSRLFMRLW